MEGFNPDKSEFNSAFAYLNRINQQFYEIIEAKSNQDVMKWSLLLESVFAEIAPEFKGEEYKQYEAELINIKNGVIQDQNRKQKDPKLWVRMRRFEINMRMIMKRAGMQLKYSQDPAKALI